MSTKLPDPSAAFHLDEDDRQRVLEALFAARGLDFRQYRVSTIVRRLGRRFAAVGVRDVEEYLELLSAQPAELDHLVDFLTLKVTAFFRDAQAFDALSRVVVPELVQRAVSEGRDLVAWSVGCATGEEVYSLAMLLLEQCEAHGTCLFPRVLGTDIDACALQTARAGIYRPVQLKGLSQERLDRWLTPTGTQDGAQQVVAALRSAARFEYHDLTGSSPLPPDSSHDGLFDLVSCRNVLIYMQRPLQLQVIETLDRFLRPGGYLVLGEAEALPDCYGTSYSALDRRSRVFCKSRQHVAHPTDHLKRLALGGNGA